MSKPSTRQSAASPRTEQPAPQITLTAREYTDSLRQAFRAGLRASIMDDPQGAVAELSGTDADEDDVEDDDPDSDDDTNTDDDTEEA